MFMANPELSDADGELLEDEGCLSIPGPYHPDAAVRARSAAADWTSTGKPFEMVGEGLLARIFQHETDHLDGMLYIDRLDEEGRRDVMAELRRIEMGLAEPRPAPQRDGGSTRRILAACASCSSATTRGRCRRSRRSPRAGHRGRARRHAPAAAGRARPQLTPDPGRGRGRATLDLPLAEVDRVRDGEGSTPSTRASPTSLVVVAYGEILTARRARHPAARRREPPLLAPASLAGAAPVQHAILAGDEVTGVTAMLMDEGLDTGPILATVETPIEPEEDAGSLGRAARRARRAAARRDARRLDDGPVEPRSQDDARATFAPKLAARRADDRLERSPPTRSCGGSGRSRRSRGGDDVPAGTAEGAAARERARRRRQLAEPGTGRIVAEDGTPASTASARARSSSLEVAPGGRERMTRRPSGRAARDPSPASGSDEPERPRGRRSRSIRRVTEQGAYSNLVLPAALARSGLDERDRAFATELAYGTIRHVPGSTPRSAPAPRDRSSG